MNRRRRAVAAVAVVALAGVQTLGTTINELLWEFIARQ